MAGGLVALLDDIAALTRLAAASADDVGAAAGRASAKAAGVIVDDAAVTPRYVQGLAPERELSVVARIAKGSLRNKLLFILPALLLLSQFLPWVLTPLLMLGGAYLCFEGAEKIWEKVAGHEKQEVPMSAMGSEREDQVVSGAVRTDFILSAEIMVISLNEVAAETFWSRAVILAVVALGITVLVYGVVALIVKTDDVGLALAERSSTVAQKVGRFLVRAMPKVLWLLTVVGVAAMLWVGGHILLVGMDELGVPWIYDAVHHLEEAVAGAIGVAEGLWTWLTNTAVSALLGLAVGAVVVAALHLLPRRRAAH
ncbi:DUF808 domain-containing protein [Aeromicrobium halocynthiae]|uniref:DUF808 domain-containing protein n=1 Tax=Aeromicrobium halocynthiae TaxID=560557 RepID=A0ABN2W1H7_9ACTN